MRTRVFYRGNLNDFVAMKNRLLYMGAEFETGETTFTRYIKIVNEGVKLLYSEDTLSFSDMGLMAKLKKQIAQNVKRLNISFDFSPDKIKYSVYNYDALTPDTDIFNVCEIDLKAAYFYTCNNMGLIDKEMFDKLMTLPKLKRLKILGSIATVKTITRYNNGKQVDQPEVRKDALTRSAWFYITSIVDTLLISLIDKLKQDFLFYYVDGIYFNDTELNRLIVEREFTLNKFLYSQKKIEYIRVTRSGNLIVKDNEGQRPFFVTRKKIKKYAYATVEQINNYNKFK